MPRLLAKLIQRIKAVSNKDVSDLHKKPTVRRPAERAPKALPPNYSPQNRRHSILIDEVNPIMHRDAFVHHKAQRPMVPSVTGRRRPKESGSQKQEMSEHECHMWSDPYLRMLGSPLRQCLVTQKYLPVDFMVRLAALQLKGHRFSRPILALLPDGVEHPRFRRRNSGRGWHITSHKMVFTEMLSRNAHKRIPVSGLHVHSLLAEQIAQQLRLRVLQEIELMAELLRCAPQTSLENTVIRRLTRKEWAEIKATGRIPQPGAVAILVVPPLKATLRHMKRKNSAKYMPEDEQPQKSVASLPPLSILHRTQAVRGASLDQLLSSPQVPLYNGLALFPSRPMRLKLYQALQNALLVERKARWRQALASKIQEKATKPRRMISKMDKASHAYLLRSDGHTVVRADSVPLAIALWRLRMWEGQGWDKEIGNYGGWEETCYEER